MTDPTFKENKSHTCLNCRAQLHGKYCSQCGQKDIPARQTLGELFVNFIGSFTSFESKFFTTVRYLLFKPGFLAEEYNKGRRERYYHPARAYVFISFVFFLILFWPSSDEDFDEGFSQSVSADGDTTNWHLNFTFDSISFDTRTQYDSIQNALPENKRDSRLKRVFTYRQIELQARYKHNGVLFVKDIREATSETFPKVLFYLLPIFALLLKLLYFRRDFYYSEHLVFSIQYYNFFYLTASIAMLIALIPWMNWINIVAYTWIVIYLFLAMKRVYKQGWGKTLAKYFLFCFLFLFCVTIGLIVDFIFVTLFVI